MSGLGTSTQTGNQVQDQSQNQNTSQSATGQLTPWGPGSNVLSGILGNVGNVDPNLSPTGTNAIANLTGVGGAGTPYLNQQLGVVGGLLGGGGAQAYAGPTEQAYEAYAQGLQPFTNPAYLDPMNTPGIGQQLQTVQNDITNQVRGSFAGAGRTDSGAEQQALSRGLAQGMAPILTGQYNTNVQNQLGALGNTYGAANSTLGALGGMQQQANANQLQGIGAAGNVFGAQSAGPELQLQALSMQTGIPLQNLAQMMGIALPSTQAFGQQTGTGAGTSTGTSYGTGQTSQQTNMSPAQQFSLLTSGLGKLFGG